MNEKNIIDTDILVYANDSAEARKQEIALDLIKDHTEVSDEIGKMTVPGGKCVFARFDGDTTQFGQAWDWVFSTWFPSSGYQPDDRPVVELYHCGKNEETGKFDVIIYVPERTL